MRMEATFFYIQNLLIFVYRYSLSKFLISFLSILIIFLIYYFKFFQAFNFVLITILIIFINLLYLSTYPIAEANRIPLPTKYLQTHQIHSSKLPMVRYRYAEASPERSMGKEARH